MVGPGVTPNNQPCCRNVAIVFGLLVSRVVCFHAFSLANIAPINANWFADVHGVERSPPAMFQVIPSGNSAMPPLGDIWK